MPRVGVPAPTTSRSHDSVRNIHGSRFGTLEADPVITNAAAIRGSGGASVRTSTERYPPRHAAPSVSWIIAAKGPRRSATLGTGSPVVTTTIVRSVMSDEGSTAHA